MNQLSAIEEKNLQPSISVIVPIYNVEAYLKECLDSLIHQTLKNIEIIAINDGSTDSSPNIIDGYVNKYPELIKVIHQANSGLSAARNVGINESKGQYIAFVDSDDWVDLNMFEEMYRKAIISESDIVVCAIAKIKEGSSKPTKLNIRGDLSDYGHSISDKPNLLYASRSYACNKIYHSKLFVSEQHRFPVGQWYEDSATIYPLMFDANKISCVPKRFYNYRFSREGAITNALSPKIFDIFKSCDAILKFYSEKETVYRTLLPTLQQIIVNHILVRFELFSKTTLSEKWLAVQYIKYAFNYLDTNFPGWEPGQKSKLRDQKRFKVYLAVFFPFILGLIPEIRTTLRKNRRALRKTKTIAAKKQNLQRHGFLILDDLRTIFNNISITYFADFGTLLGFVRDGGFMPHDLDLDIGVFADEGQKKHIKLALEKAGYKIWRAYTLKDKVVEESYHYVKGDIEFKFDINYYENSDDHSKTWLFYKDPIIQYQGNKRSVVEMTYSAIKGTTSIDVKGNSIPIPINSERLLEEKYGVTWKKPNKEWIYWKSPAARTLGELGEFV